MIKDIYRRIADILLTRETVATRFFFGLLALFWSIVFGFGGVGSDEGHGIEFELMLSIAPPTAWAFFYFIHASALLYGSIFNKYSKYKLILEGVLGVILWTTMGIVNWIAQGAPGPMLVGGAIAFWLLVRYPCNTQKG